MEYDEFTPQWSATITMDINAVRMWYDFICYSIQMWPGAPARPVEEQEMLHNMKMKLFTLMMEHNLTEL